MSGSGWSVRIAAIGALFCLAFVSLGLGAFFGALNAPHYGYQAEYPTYRAADAKQQNPSQIDRDRAGLPQFAERIASGPDPESTDEREKRDLAAQESMSVWAFWLLLISGAGTVTTMIGTGFLLWQIILTRKAVTDTGKATVAMERQNEIAQEFSERQDRAYVSVTSIKVEGFKPNQSPLFKIIIENLGKSIAKDTQYMAAVFIHRAPPGAEHSLKLKIRFPHTFGTTIDLPPGNTWPIRYHWPEGVLEDADEHLDVHRGVKTIVYAGIIRYRDVFGKRHYTTVCRRLHPSYMTDGSGDLLMYVRGNRSS